MTRYVKVALFFILLGGAGTAYIVISADGLSGFNTKPYEVTLADATGLSTRSQVFLAGVPVGKIAAIKLDGKEAHITLALLKDVEVRQNASISRKSSSILGTAILSLDPGTELTPVLAPGGTIGTGTRDADMGAIMGTVTDMGAQVSAILSEFQNTQMKLLEVSLENFNSISGKLDARMEAELDRVTRILENAALITERTERIIAARESDISLSVMEMRIALENIRQISGEIAAGRGNMGQAIYDDRVYENLVSTLEETEKAVVKMQSVIDGAGEFVGRANGLGIKLDTRIDYGFLRNQVMAGASVRLEPASGVGWYRVGVNTAPEGVASRTVTTTTVSGVPGTTVVDETENKYTFSIDAEIARRIGIVTLRGGILENTAGIGVDVQPLKWMMVSAEAFRFRSNEVPNLRGTLTFYPFFDPDSRNPLRWLYLQGGITDALSDSRDFFAGGGLRFSDHDIKGMVGLATGVAGAR